MSRSRGKLALEATPFVIMGAVAVAVVLIRRALDALPLLSLGPAFATATGELIDVLVTGGTALVLCAALAAYRHLIAAAPGVLAFATIAGVMVAGITARAGDRRRRRKVTELLAIAQAAQRVLSRPMPQQVGRVTMAARFLPGARGAGIGGVMYDTAITDTGLRLIIGDVQGKGLPPAQTAAAVLGAFRQSAYDAPSLAVIASRIETSLARQAAGGQVVTALLAQVNDNGSSVALLNRGHPPPLLLRAGAAAFIEPARPAAPLGPAGFMHRAGERAQPLGEIVPVPFGPGDSMLFYTGAISEARNRSGEFFPLSRSLSQGGAAEPGAVLARLCDDVVRHAGHPLGDDAAMFLITHAD